MIDRGKLVILLIVGLAVAATAFSWWYNVQRGDRALQFWGSDVAVRIRYAPRVELLVLGHGDGAPSGVGTRVVPVGGRNFRVIQRCELSRAPGLVHARHALIQDASFAWHSTPDSDPRDWRFALRFSSRERDSSTTIVFDAHCDHVLLCGPDRQACVRPIASGLRTFLAEQYRPK